MAITIQRLTGVQVELLTDNVSLVTLRKSDVTQFNIVNDGSINIHFPGSNSPITVPTDIALEIIDMWGLEPPP